MAATTLIRTEIHHYVRQCSECRDHFDATDPKASTCPVCDDQRKRSIIAAQNDLFRRTLGNDPIWNGQKLEGQAVTTPGFRALPEDMQIILLREVVNFNAFDKDCDPWGDHSFGVAEMNGYRIFWKIDLYDADYTFGVSLIDAIDPAQVRRVLTIYLPSEH